MNETNFGNWTLLAAEACLPFWNHQASNDLIIPEDLERLSIISYASIGCLFLPGLIFLVILCLTRNETNDDSEDQDLELY